MNFTVVKYSSEYRQDVLELQKHLWNPQMEINDDYLSWKYENNPYLDERLIYLILADERVVGMRDAWGSSWQMGQEGEALPVACVGDLVIEPEHRDKGLYKKIMDFALVDLADLGYEYVFNLSAGYLTQLGALAMGWRSIGVMDVRKRLGIVYRIQRRLRRHLGMEEPNPFDQLDRKLGKMLRSFGRSIVFEKNPRPEQMAALVVGLKRDDRLRHDKSTQSSHRLD